LVRAPLETPPTGGVPKASDRLGLVGKLPVNYSLLPIAQPIIPSALLESAKTYEATHDIHTLIIGEHIIGIAAF